MWSNLLGESTFARAFTEFAEADLVERTHAALVPEVLGDSLVGHISRDGTAIEVREKLAKKVEVPEAQATEKERRGRPGKGETREAIPGKFEQ